MVNVDAPDTPETSPEAVEQIAQAYDDPKDTDPLYLPNLTAATLRALSAERDALKAELAEAVGVATRLADWIEHDSGCDLPFDARAFLARHQRETGA